MGGAAAEISEEIQDPQLIAGFLREALFHGRTLWWSSGSRFAELRIVRLWEGATRGQSESRLLELQLIAQNEELVRGEVGHFECGFPEFVAGWTGSFVVESSEALRVALPDRIRISNQRIGQRYPVRRDANLQGPVLVYSGGVHTEAEFTLEDHSRGGVGGLLRGAASVPLQVGTRISGSLLGHHGKLEVTGTVVSAKLISSGPETGEEPIYRVGVKTASGSSLSESHGEGARRERRRFGRQDAGGEIEVISPLNSRHGCRLNLREISVSGCSARLMDWADLNLLPVGTTVQLKSQSLQLRVVSAREDRLGLQITDGDPSDRLAWLKRMTDREGVLHAQQSGVGSDLIDLFCRSGAFSSEYLRLQAASAESLRTGLSSGLNQSGWLHRWIQRGNRGEALGHMSAVRYGDSVWHVGDLAGVGSGGKKLGESFIPSFLLSFRDFCRSSRPCPRVIMTWNSGHPYWQAYEAFLKAEGSPFVSSWITAAYHRQQKEVGGEGRAAPCEGIEIQPDDYEVIREVESKLVALGLADHARALDFSIENFGSLALAKNLRDSGFSWFRRYARLVTRSESWLMILQGYPAGTSPHRSLDVPWLFPLQAESSESSRAVVFVEARKFALAHGYSFPGILEAQPYLGAQAVPGSKLMSWIVGHPRVLDFFGRPRA